MAEGSYEGNPFVTISPAGGAAAEGVGSVMTNKPYTGSDSYSWDWQNSYIETDHTHIPHLAAQPDATLFMVGPSRLAGTNGKDGGISPVGYVQGIQASQQRMVQRLYDFGSARSFFTVGKNSGTITLSRLFFRGTNLLSSLYTYALENGDGGGGEGDNNFDQSVFNSNMYSTPGKGKLEDKKGSEAFFIDIGSELFLNPFGCGIIYRSKGGHAVGGVYFELCMFNTHTIQMDPNTPQMMENVNIEFDRAVPMALTDSLVKKMADK